MSNRFASIVLPLVLIGAGTQVCHAVTFTWSVSCSPVTLGPVTISLSPYSSSDIGYSPFNLTYGVTLTGQVLLPTNQTTIMNSKTSGTFTGTLSCTLVFGGASTPFTRSLSLVIPSSLGSGLLTTGAVTVGVNLGSTGGVTITAPTETTLGYDGGLITPGGIIVVPFSADNTLLLSPNASGGGTIPAMSTWGLMFTAMLLGLAGAGLLRRYPLA